MIKSIQSISPINGDIYAERDASSIEQAVEKFASSKQAQSGWANTTLDERCKILNKAVDYFVQHTDDIAEEIAWQMGRPANQAKGEMAGLEERARHMLKIAPEALEDITISHTSASIRHIKKVPLGVIFVIAPWNFPYLTACNSIFPALAAGNSIVLKHSAQTLVCAERFLEAFNAAGVPDDVFQIIHMKNDDTLQLIEKGLHQHIVFTGSVEVGRLLQKTNAHHFSGIDLELGGKDPAYVRDDANIPFAVEQLVDGSFFNSGQSCCGIERIYVHKNNYDEFIELFVNKTNQYILGNPLDGNTTLGPVVKSSAADFIRDQVNDAVNSGAQQLVNQSNFPNNKVNSPYLAPQVLINVNHEMRVMQEESFGPVVGIMQVNNDEEAIHYMNDSDFGLTCSIWTANIEIASNISNQLYTGTCFANRCDYLDPALAWTGTKDTGSGCSLSIIAYDRLTRPMSFNLSMQPISNLKDSC